MLKIYPWKYREVCIMCVLMSLHISTPRTYYLLFFCIKISPACISNYIFNYLWFCYFCCCEYFKKIYYESTKKDLLSTKKKKKRFIIFYHALCNLGRKTVVVVHATIHTHGTSDVKWVVLVVSGVYYSNWV